MLDLTPTTREMRLVHRCMLLKEVLFGSQAEIWTSPSAYRMLVTLRLCIEAIDDLSVSGHEVCPSFIKAVVMQTNELGDVPFCLDEVAEHLCDDEEARAYWQGMLLDELYPHRCPTCGAAAYIGLRMIECKMGCRP